MTDSLASAVVLPPTQVEELIRSLVKGLRASQMYLPNNPVYQRAVRNVGTAFQPIWSAMDELVLTIAETDFVWEEQVVYHQLAKSESLAWLLYKDGMRVLTLKRGVEEEEIVRFLEVVHRARMLPADANDDLPTLLWEQEFHLITYQFMEFQIDAAPLTADQDSTGEGRPGPEVQQQVREDLKAGSQSGVAEEAEEEAPKRAGVIGLEEFDSTLYFLEEREIAYLSSQIQNEYAQDLRGNAMAILFDLFELQTDEKVRTEIVGVLEHLFPYLLNARAYRTVASTLRELRSFRARITDLPPELHQRMDEFPARLSSSEVLGQLLQTIDEATVAPSEVELGELFRELRPAALEMLLTWLPKLTSPRIKDLAAGACERLAEANPAEVLRVLRSPESEALLGAIHLCERLRLSAAIQVLGDLVGHRETPLRLAAVQALGAIGSSAALSHLSGAIDDQERDVRVAAVRYLGNHGYKGALRRIEDEVLSRDLKTADLTEKMVFFEAYGLIVGASGLDRLRTLLAPRGGLLRLRQDPQMRACAAIALGKIGTPEARAALQGAVNDRDVVVRNAVSRALREMGS